MVVDAPDVGVDPMRDMQPFHDVEVAPYGRQHHWRHSVRVAGAKRGVGAVVAEDLKRFEAPEMAREANSGERRRVVHAVPSHAAAPNGENVDTTVDRSPHGRKVVALDGGEKLPGACVRADLVWIDLGLVGPDAAPIHAPADAGEQIGGQG